MTNLGHPVVEQLFYFVCDNNSKFSRNVEMTIVVIFENKYDLSSRQTEVGSIRTPPPLVTFKSVKEVSSLSYSIL